MARIVTTWASKGGAKKIETDAKTWGELKGTLSAHYDLNNLQATEGASKVTYTEDGATLPEGDFKIFFKPMKVKSGTVDYANLSYKEYKVLMKENEDLKKYMAECITDGRNWTQYKTDEFRKYVPKFFATAGASNRPAGNAHQESEKNAADVVESVKGAKASKAKKETTEAKAEDNGSFSVVILGYIDSIISEARFVADYSFGNKLPFVHQKGIGVLEAITETKKLSLDGVISIIIDENAHNVEAIITEMSNDNEAFIVSPISKLEVLKNTMSILREFSELEDEEVDQERKDEADYVADELGNLLDRLQNTPEENMLKEEESTLTEGKSVEASIEEAVPTQPEEQRETESERLAREEREFQEKMKKEGENFFKN